MIVRLSLPCPSIRLRTSIVVQVFVPAYGDPAGQASWPNTMPPGRLAGSPNAGCENVRPVPIPKPVSEVWLSVPVPSCRLPSS